MRRIAALWVVFLLLPAPALRADDAPQALIAAVHAYAEKKGVHERPQFRYALADLDGNGHDDAIVLLEDSIWCGSGGCTMLVFRGTKDVFKYVSGSTVTNTPIRISDDKAAGWKTLIVYS